MVFTIIITKLLIKVFIGGLRLGPWRMVTEIAQTKQLSKPSFTNRRSLKFLLMEIQLSQAMVITLRNVKNRIAMITEVSKQQPDRAIPARPGAANHHIFITIGPPRRDRTKA
jgi:hypothetical protein